MKILLAPILGHTDFVFRNTLARNFQGIDGWYCPFITTVKGRSVRDSHLRDVLPKYNKLKNTVPQLIGKDAEEFIVLANQLFAMKYPVVGWNLGCPYPMVVNKKRGAGLLPYPEMIESFLDKVIPNVKCRISVKTRLGKERPDEIFDVIPILNKYPLEEIIIHPRTAKQMYGGSVDLDAFEECLAPSKHPVIYNGDIVDVNSFKMISTRFASVSSFMIGRGILMDPGLQEAIKGIPSTHFKERLYRFHEDLVRGYQQSGCDEISLLGRLKQLWCYLSFSFIKNEEMLKKVQRAKSMEKYWETVKESFVNGIRE
ncbi:MAG TPA: tRNA-dihydrouridine synthase family protein [Chitinivibrionales bacterium]|nr:tRNA-dihydrouridine synthase family protein [Chitinivibrionales bacterium]